MSLWLALSLPSLPLQLAQRALDPALAGVLALAIIEGPPQHPVVAFCNRAARSAGVVPGLKLAAAQALARDLIAIERQPPRERDALAELACWAYQFSAQVAPLARPSASGVLIETGASERLFGGRPALRQRIVRGLRGLGYHAADGAAATPRAAWLIAQARARGLAAGDAAEPAGLRAVLAPLPLTLLDWDEAATGTLQALGLTMIGDLLRLPRDAFARRFGAHRLADLDRTLGALADPQPRFVPPERFEARIELPADVTESSQLMFPARRLLRLLEGFLRGRNAGTAGLLLRARHSPRRSAPIPPTPIDLALAVPERNAGRLAQLLEERLTRVTLPEPAIALELTVERFAAFAPPDATLLPPAPQTGPQGLSWLQLAETLHARLGSERVFQLQAIDDHRPEHAYRIMPLAIDAAELRGTAAAALQRPLLILPTPQPLRPRAGDRGGSSADDGEPPEHGGPLALLAGPERIEAGWWDVGRRPTVHRDYFVARNRRGQTLWIYRELAAPRGWYLHGFFA